MSLLDELIAKEKERKKKRVWIIIFIAVIFSLLFLKKCESNSGSEAINSSINKIQPQTKKNKANYTLSGSILSEKEERIKLNAYKIEIEN